MDWYEEQKRKMERSLRDELNTNRDTNITAEERNNDVSVSETRSAWYIKHFRAFILEKSASATLSLT